MKELIYNLFSLSTLFALACSLITDKRFDGVLRLCFSVVFSSVIFLSVGNLLSEGIGVPDFIAPAPSESSSAFTEALEAASREGVVRSLSQRFSLAEEEILVEFDAPASGEYLSRSIRITLTGRAALADYRAIENYLYEGGYENVRIKLSVDP